MPMRSATAACVSAVLLTAIAHGAPFDERIKSPQAGTTAELRELLQAHFDTFRRKQEEGRVGAFIRDEAAYERWVDLEYRIGLAMDQALPLTDLADFGLIAEPDGTYTVDLKKYPQWEPLDSRLHVLSDASVLESYVPTLKARGFRDADIDILRTYLAAHDPRAAAFPEGKELIESFAQRLRKRQAAGLPLDLNEVMAWRYQKFRLKRAARRQWALGLLDALDDERRGTLVSFLSDGYDRRLAFGAPRVPFNQMLERQVQPLISGEYVELLAQAESWLRRMRESRMEELSGGLPK